MARVQTFRSGMISTSVTVDLRTREFRNAVRNDVNSAIQISAEKILQDSKTECPFDTGVLENSGVVVFDATTHKATIAYNTPYAARLHEHPEYNFQGKGKGKWLQRAIERNRNLVGRVMQTVFRRDF